MAKNKEQLSGFQKFLVSKRFKKIMGYFYGWGAGVNFLAEIYLIWNLYKRLYKKDE